MSKLNRRITLRVAVIICVTCSCALAMGIAGSDPKWRMEQEEDLIRDGLPGQPKVQFKQYAGYITVNAMAGRALFYWLTEADTENPHSLPLILWLEGGPGCSGIAVGAMEQIGPFKVLPSGSGLSMNRYSWNKVANLLFVESPAGVGFSYTNTSSDLTTFGDKRTATDAHIFLIKWFERFPQYKGRIFYIIGESYAGRYVPQLAKLVYEQDMKGVKIPDINLKGVMVGNGALDRYYDNVGLIEYWWDHALISDKTYNGILTACDFHKENLSATCQHFIDYATQQELADMDLYNIYAPLCASGYQSQMFTEAESSRTSPSTQHVAGYEPYDPCLPNYAAIYLNRPDVQKAFHANITGIGYKWTRCSAVLYENWQDVEFSMIPVYKELISAGLKIWFFSGDVDGVVPITGTRYGVQHMNLTETERWFSWYLDGQVGGRCQPYEGLSLLTVRNAGHQVAWTAPERAFVVIKSYLASDDIPLLPRNKTS